MSEQGKKGMLTILRMIGDFTLVLIVLKLTESINWE